MKTIAVREVELLSVGMKWQSANGELTFTFQHLADAAAAAEDPHIQPPRLKVGHSDARFNDLENDHDPFALIGDGEPAIGSVRNIRLANEGSMLVGDYVDVPIWLAEALPTAFPSRSIEGAWSMKEGPAGEAMGSWDVETPGGKRYTFVLTACALLGVVGPAIANLDDLRNWLVEGKGLVVAGAPPVEGAVPADASTVPDVTLIPEMSADVEQVVDKFCHDFASSPDEEGYWWWPISLETDAGTLYCDDEEGGIMAVPYTTDEDTNVEFGEPYRVIKRYEAAPEPAEMAAVLCHGNPAVVFRSVKETPLAARHAAKKPTKDRGSKASATVSAMDFSSLSADARKRLAVSLSLAEEATDEEITEALEAEETPETEETPAEETPAVESPAPAASGPETLTVDKAVWERSQSEIARLSAIADREEEKRRDALLDGAIGEGKIMLSSKPDWAAKLSAAPEATEAEIEKLAPGLVPTSQVGHSQQVVEAGGAVGGMTPAEATAQLFPNLANEKGEL